LIGRDSSSNDSEFAQFDAAFQPDQGVPTNVHWSSSDTKALIGFESDRIARFFGGHARPSYNNGVLRMILPGGNPDLVGWNGPEGWQSDWPDAKGMVAFAYDWLGRLYAVDKFGTWGERGQVGRLVPGTGSIEATDIPVDNFLFDRLPSEHEDFLSEDYWRDWLAAGGSPLAADQCVGYRIPLMLGGEDDVPNLEVVSLRVYLSSCGQLAAQLPEAGTEITGVRLEY
jgi:hypothetical protein